MYMKERGYPHPSESGASKGNGDVGREAPGRPDDSSREAKTGMEVSREIVTTKEHVAEVFWERPKQFVERVIAKGAAPFLRRFLAHFGSLDDEAMAIADLRRVRDAARAASEKGGASEIHPEK